MRVLVTRPFIDAQSTASRLRAMGHVALIAPLLDIRFRAGPELSLDGVQAVVATSANGVRAFARRTVRRDLPVFAVGAQTASEARVSGFFDVKHSDGDSAKLADAIASWTIPQRGSLLHASGNEVGGRLAARLGEHRFELRREVLYDVAPVEELPSLAREALEKNNADAVLLYSPRSAETFVRCVRAAGLQEKSRTLKAVCISSVAAEAAQCLPLGEVCVAVRPAEDEMLRMLAR